MDQLELLKKVLRLPQHWHVVDVDADEETRQLTVSLHFARTRRRLLGGETNACARCGQSLAPTPASRYLQLRHLPLADWQVNLRLPDATTGCADRACPASVELAEPGTRVTHALATRIVALHTGGASLVTTAALLDVDVTDVAIVLAARGMPVDALTGEIALSESLLTPELGGDALAPVDALASGASRVAEEAVADAAQPEATGEDAAGTIEAAPGGTTVEETPLAPIAASIPEVELLSAQDSAAADDVLAVPEVEQDVLSSAQLVEPSPPPMIPVPQPVPTNTLLAADEAQAQAVLEEAIDGETDALAHASIDEQTDSSATLVEVDEEVVAVEADETPETAAEETEAEEIAEPQAAELSDDVAAGDADGAVEEEEDEGAGAGAGVELVDPEAVHITAVDETVSAEAEPEPAEADAEPTVALEVSSQEDAAAPVEERAEVAEAGADATADGTGDTAAVPVLSARARVPELPPVEHPVWAALLGGELVLETEALALQMLLARLKQFVAKSDDPSAVSAAARVLHKHLGQSVQRYAGERAQLLSAVAAAASAGAPSASGESAADTSTDGHEATVVIDEATAAAIPTLQPSASVAASTIPVPPIESAVWAQLVTGERPLATSSVALKMMLEQIKRSVQSDGSQATRVAGVRLLHTFFSKTARQLTSELRQLNEGATTEQPAQVEAPDGDGAGESAAVEAVPVVQPRIPPETSSSWQALLDGSVVPSREDPGLSMLLEKVRRVTSQGETTGEVMAAAARVLRRYLARYARRHVDLLAELNSIDLSTTTQQRTSRLSRTWRGGGRRGSAGGAATSPSNVDVPSVDDPVWRRLMDGDLLLETEAFALRMMLERIRRSVRRDPSESNRQAAALQLRDYFVKHERVHRAELQRIRAA